MREYRVTSRAASHSPSVPSSGGEVHGDRLGANRRACIAQHRPQDKVKVELKEPLRDVRNIGHVGTGDLEIRVTSDDHLDIAKEMIARSYENSGRPSVA